MSFDGDQYASDEGLDLTTKGQIHTHDSSANAALNVGSNTYLLTADSTETTGMKWAASGATAPTTTKGDISGFSTTQARIPISTNNFSLFADSAQALGLKWAASPTSTLTTTGDLLASSAPNTLTRIAGGASGEILTGNGAGVLPTFQAAAGGGGSLELIEAHTFDGSETAHIFTTDMNFNTTYSDMIVVFQGLITAGSTSMYCRTNGRTINYYSVSRSNGTQTTTSNDTEAFLMSGMGSTYQNICVIHCSTALKPAGTFMASNDVGQVVITGGFGNTNSNTDAGILTEFEVFLSNAPASTAHVVQYGVKMT